LRNLTDVAILHENYSSFGCSTSPAASIWSSSSDASTSSKPVLDTEKKIWCWFMYLGHLL
jgi:hypothetical protein